LIGLGGDHLPPRGEVALIRAGSFLMRQLHQGPRSGPNCHMCRALRDVRSYCIPAWLHCTIMTLMRVSFGNLDTEGVRLNGNNELVLGMGVLEASMLPRRTSARTTLAFAGRFKLIFAALSNSHHQR
jgi:hypothetical protein